MVVVALMNEPQRFSQIRQALGSVTAKVLTQTLRDMTQDGLITRTDRKTNPPNVEYALTPLGLSLMPVIDVMRAWSEQHLGDLLACRRQQPASNPQPVTLS
jgi:DNA-binding HxlR family transcriptional regulator